MFLLLKAGEVLGGGKGGAEAHKSQEQLSAPAKLFSQQQPSSPSGPQYHLEWAGFPLTFTEWLWKSVTTISFLLLTATKCGPEQRKWEERSEEEPHC